MSKKKDYQKSLIIATSLTVLAILFFNPVTTFAEIDQNKSPMTLDWKLKDTSDETFRSLQDGDKILVCGTINAGYESTFEIGETQTDVSLVLSDPMRERISLEQVKPVCAYDQCYFEWTITVGGSMWKHMGQYEIQACYFGYNNPQGQCTSTEISYTQETQSYTEPKSIQSIITLKPYENGGVQVNVKFLDVIGQIIKHTNYDITASHNSEIILKDTGVHVHGESGQHITAPIDLRSNHDNEIKIEVVFRGIGVNEPYGGPVGKIFKFSQDLTPSNDSTNIEQLQKENKLLKEENLQLQSKIKQLQDKIDNLNAIIQEQISVIYKWILIK